MGGEICGIHLDSAQPGISIFSDPGINFRKLPAHEQVFQDRLVVNHLEDTVLLPLQGVIPTISNP